MWVLHTIPRVIVLWGSSPLDPTSSAKECLPKEKDKMRQAQNYQKAEFHLGIAEELQFRTHKL